MSNKNALIIYQSIHHGNTLKVAKVIGEQLNAEIKTPSEVQTSDINKYDIIGFGSGIYDDKHHKSIFNFIDKLSKQNRKKAFIFSTSGVPIKILGKKFFLNYTKKCTNFLEKELTAKGFKVIGDLSLPGFNTNVFLKYIGGINKNRPNEKDLTKAKEFAIKIKDSF